MRLGGILPHHLPYKINRVTQLPNTLLTCYQHTSEESMLAVMESPKKLLSIR